MSMPSRLSECRLCGNQRLVEILDLGYQYLTGVFPRPSNAGSVACGPLRLVKCYENSGCGLVQLDHSYEPMEMYGENYGYRSGLNAKMVSHLYQKIGAIQAQVELRAGDLVVDIGSNDGTSLGFYPSSLLRVGIDPTAGKFADYYADGAVLISEFFSAEAFTRRFPANKARVVTSFSMLYDLEKPLAFANDVSAILDEVDGIWVFEQSYLPMMLSECAFDTICHEHLEYYGLAQIEWMLERASMKLIDVEFNDVNGGSFSVVAAHKRSIVPERTQNLSTAFAAEKRLRLDQFQIYESFGSRVRSARDALVSFIQSERRLGRRFAGLGASTKGNVLLQYCGLTADDIEIIGEVNPDKFGTVTPGTNIPIGEESAVLSAGYDYLIVLPWHFKDFFLRSPHFKGQRLLFPLPHLNVVSI